MSSLWNVYEQPLTDQDTESDNQVAEQAESASDDYSIFNKLETQEVIVQYLLWE